ncbi:hypothetical protein ACB092_01G266600 [Castanea dentata]
MKITKTKQKLILTLKNLIKTHKDTKIQEKKKKKTHKYFMRLQKKPINKPINNSKSKLEKMENHEKQTFALQHHAHGGSSMFTSSSNESGDLCGGMLRFVVWWRFGQGEVEDGRGRKRRKLEIFA